MTETTAPASLSFFGWRVVAAAFVFALFAWGVGFYGPSVFLHTLHQRRGWDVAPVSAAITVHFLLSAVMVAYLDDAHRRFGVAATSRAGAVALAAGTIGWAVATSPWQLFAVVVLTALGWSATSGAAINAMLAPWFRRRRGLALSLAFNGASIGGVVFIPLWVTLIEHFGFVRAAAMIAAAILVVLWPLAGRYLRLLPAELGLLPDGDERPHGAATAVASRPPVSRKALLRDRRFLTLSVAFSVGLFAQVGLIAHLVTLLAPGLGDEGAAGAASLTPACAVIGRLALGAFIDRADRRCAAAGNFSLQILGVALLLLGTSPVPLLLGCVLFGLGLGNLVSLPPLIAEVEFDADDLGRVVALAIAINQGVFSFAPGVFGALHDLAGGYRASLALAMALEAVAAATIFLGRTPRRL